MRIIWMIKIFEKMKFSLISEGFLFMYDLEFCATLKIILLTENYLKYKSSISLFIYFIIL